MKNAILLVGLVALATTALPRCLSAAELGHSQLAPAVGDAASSQAVELLRPRPICLYGRCDR